MSCTLLYIFLTPPDPLCNPARSSFERSLVVGQRSLKVVVEGGGGWSLLGGLDTATDNRIGETAVVENAAVYIF